MRIVLSLIVAVLGGLAAFLGAMALYEAGYAADAGREVGAAPAVAVVAAIFGLLLAAASACYLAYHVSQAAQSAP